TNESRGCGWAARHKRVSQAIGADHGEDKWSRWNSAVLWRGSDAGRWSAASEREDPHRNPGWRRDRTTLRRLGAEPGDDYSRGEGRQVEIIDLCYAWFP